MKCASSFQAVHLLASVLGKQCTLLVKTEHFIERLMRSAGLQGSFFRQKICFKCSLWFKNCVRKYLPKVFFAAHTQCTPLQKLQATKPYLCSSTISLLRESSSLMAEKSAARLAALFCRQTAQFNSSQRPLQTENDFWVYGIDQLWQSQDNKMLWIDKTTVEKTNNKGEKGWNEVTKQGYQGNLLKGTDRLGL